jgi:hypothetical protein
MVGQSMIQLALKQIDLISGRFRAIVYPGGDTTGTNVRDPAKQIGYGRTIIES